MSYLEFKVQKCQHHSKQEGENASINSDSFLEGGTLFCLLILVDCFPKGNLRTQAVDQKNCFSSSQPLPDVVFLKHPSLIKLEMCASHGMGSGQSTSGRKNRFKELSEMFWPEPPSSGHASSQDCANCSSCVCVCCGSAGGDLALNPLCLRDKPFS